MEIEKPQVEESTLDESVLDTFVIIKEKLINCRWEISELLLQNWR